MKTRLFRALAITSVFALALVGTADAAVIGSLNITGDTTPNTGTSVSFSGSCGSVAANGTVSFSLERSGNITSLGSASIDASGNFSSSVTVPSNFGSGNATLIATCPNGDTVTGSLNVMVAAGGDLNVSGNVGLNGSVTVSGVCGTAAAGSTVSLALVHNGVTTNLGTTATVGADGNFSTTVTIPTTVSVGPATLVATCPGGGTISAAVNVSDPDASLTVVNNNPAIGNEIRFAGVCGTTAGANVQISLQQGSASAVIGNVITSQDGVFSGTLTIPDAFVVGNANLVATCPAGNVVTAALTLTPDTDVTPPPPAAGGADEDEDDNGVLADVIEDDDTTPQGGVEAGVGGTNYLGFLLLTMAALGGMYAYKYSPKQSLS